MQGLVAFLVNSCGPGQKCSSQEFTERGQNEAVLALVREDGDHLAGLAITLGKFGGEPLGQIPVLGFHGGL